MESQVATWLQYLEDSEDTCYQNEQNLDVLGPFCAFLLVNFNMAVPTAMEPSREIGDRGCAGPEPPR